MLKRFFPDLFISNIKDIDLNLLINKKIKGLLLDIDNTLVANYIEEADNSTQEWIENAKKMGFQICILSNASYKRVNKFNQKLDILAIHRSNKPFKKSYLKAIKLMHLKNYEIAVVGDQVFTDVYGGNKMGMFTILVSPIDINECFFIKIKRRFEKIILKIYAKNKNLKNKGE